MVPGKIYTVVYFDTDSLRERTLEGAKFIERAENQGVAYLTFIHDGVHHHVPDEEIRDLTEVIATS